MFNMNFVDLIEREVYECFIEQKFCVELLIELEFCVENRGLMFEVKE